MAAGGTAIDRGTGKLDGIAQGNDADEDDSILDHGFGGAIEDVVDDETAPSTTRTAGASDADRDADG